MSQEQQETKESFLSTTTLYRAAVMFDYEVQKNREKRDLVFIFSVRLPLPLSTAHLLSLASFLSFQDRVVSIANVRREDRE